MTNELSKERAIEALYTVRAYYASLTAGYPKGKDCRGIGDVMCSEIANSCLMAIKALEQTRWIPVSEGLPELKNKYYLWTSTSGLVKMDYYDSKGIWEEAEKYCYEVIAWMPLPQPYRAESEDKEQYEADLQNAYDCGYNSGYAQAMMDIAESEDAE